MSMCVECKRKEALTWNGCCGATCRKRRQRRREKVQRALNQAMSALGDLRDSIKRKERVKESVADLKRIQDEIRDLLHLAGDVDEVQRRDMLEDRLRRVT